RPRHHGAARRAQLVAPALAPADHSPALGRRRCRRGGAARGLTISPTASTGPRWRHRGPDASETLVRPAPERGARYIHHGGRSGCRPRPPDDAGRAQGRHARHLSLAPRHLAVGGGGAWRAEPLAEPLGALAGPPRVGRDQEARWRTATTMRSVMTR